MLYRIILNNLFLSSFSRNGASNVLQRSNISKDLHSKEPPWRIMFFGSDDFAVQSLRALCSKLRTNTLISTLDVTTAGTLNRKNQRNLVYQFAELEKLKVYEWPINVSSIDGKYDLGVLVSFGYLIPIEIIESFPLGILNVHASLLPKWRGAAPIIHAVMNGDTITGVTIMKINPHKFDTGDILKQYSLAIKPNETAAELTNRLAVVGSQLLMECIRNLPISVQMVVPQQNEGVCYAKKIDPSMAFIDWPNKTAQEVYNQHRALSHLYPLKTYWFTSCVKLLNISLDEINDVNPENYERMQKLQMTDQICPGLVEFSRKRSVLRIQCNDGKWIRVLQVSITSKKKLTPNEFYNGYLSKVSNSLERKFTVTERTM